MLKKLFVVGSFALAMALSAGVAHADSYTTSGGVEFTATVTSSQVMLTVQCTEVASCGNWYLGDISIKGFTFTGSPMIDKQESSGIGDYTLMAGGMNDGNGGCNNTQLTSALCWDAPSTLLQLDNTTFVFDAELNGGTFTYTGPLHVQAVGYYGSTEETTNKAFSVSSDLVSTPEPGTLLLLGIGLFGLAVVGRHVPSA